MSEKMQALLDKVALREAMTIMDEMVERAAREPQLADIITSEHDENLMRQNLLQCYGQKTLAVRVSKEHYRYLVEQIVSLREHFKRLAALRAAGLPAEAAALSLEDKL